MAKHRYRNVQNGHEIVIPSVLTSPNWVEVGAEEASKPKEKVVHRNVRTPRVRKCQ